jgi:hypothetical protein
VKTQAYAAGHSWATVKRVKKAIRIVAFREGGTADKGRWFWRLPGTKSLRGSPNAYVAQVSDVRPLGETEPLSATVERPAAERVKTQTDETDRQIDAQATEERARLLRSGNLSGPETDQTQMGVYS